LAPLVANARAANNPFDATGRASPDNIEMIDKTEWPVKSAKRQDLQERILARVNESISKTIAKRA
jgi:hypothetical protein